MRSQPRNRWSFQRTFKSFLARIQWEKLKVKPKVYLIKHFMSQNDNFLLDLKSKSNPIHSIFCNDQWFWIALFSVLFKLKIARSQNRDHIKFRDHLAIFYSNKDRRSRSCSKDRRSVMLWSFHIFTRLWSMLSAFLLLHSGIYGHFAMGNHDFSCVSTIVRILKSNASFSQRTDQSCQFGDDFSNPISLKFYMWVHMDNIRFRFTCILPKCKESIKILRLHRRELSLR